MFPIPRFRAAALAVILAGSSLLSPIVAFAEAADLEGIPFENPSAIAAVTATPAASPDAATPASPATRHGAFLGDPDAPVTMQLYADYQCPHCRAFHASVEPLLIDDYVRTGKVRLELIDFPIIGIGSLQELTDDSKESVQAAEATMCAGEQGAWLDYRQALYEGDVPPNSGALSDENLIAKADALDLDTTSFASCLASGRYEEAVITGLLGGIDKGVQGTPTMVVNGEILLPSDYNELQEMLNQAIEAAG